MNDPWTWTTVWEQTVGAGWGFVGQVGWRRAKGENWDNCKRINTDKNMNNIKR